MGYYTGSMMGQMEIMQKRESITTLIDSPSIDTELRNQLQYVLAVREFASNSLGLPDNESYRYYADLQREYAVWNVFATPALSLENKQWCFPVAGCLSYRGFFSPEDAARFADKMEIEGMDVFVGGVRAYSTLGWFADPLLNTMMNRTNAEIAEIIFHELAHQKLFIRNETGFNEAFAETVALAGVRHWLQSHGTADELLQYESHKTIEARFVSMVMQTRNELEKLYQSDQDETTKLREKNRLLGNLKRRYQDQRWEFPGLSRYEAWFSEDVNNAKLSAVATYREYLPGFIALLHSVDGQFPPFYQQVEALSRCDRPKRERILKDRVTDFYCPG